ncbi:prepilin-type N-terminal cleavage/methylation domain-containing protein [Candidatus Peregrinibacteria bacterium]|nr:MAG: prepilin-type N-terminal cleavage/methylation domain-containing protein [Candidatus Peregrinibacteria bacterium]
MKNKAAFTLIETIIAITLTTVVMTAVTGLILSTLRANQRNLRTVQATFLAQEGLEAVRFMRDSNVLQNYAWDSGSDLWMQDFHVEALSPSLTLYLVPKLCTVPTPCFQVSNSAEDARVTLDNGFQFERQVDFHLLYDENENPRP